ncbi:MAG: sorbosone dehydrogenase family protein, partial [Phycisphaerae bacterium]
MRAYVILVLSAVLFSFAAGAGCPLFPQPSPTGPSLALDEVARGLAAPVVLTHAGDGSGRLFIAEQAGRVRVLDSSDTLLSTPFLDIRDRVAPLNAAYDERGLLGLAFHPRFSENGLFYVYYSLAERSATRLSEFRVSAADSNRAELSSERVLIEIDQPQNNHNGGQLAFGPHDGLLYIATGDGGGADDTDDGHTPVIGNAQDLTKLLGKILRIDVDRGDPYAIPDDNPFAGSDDGTR